MSFQDYDHPSKKVLLSGVSGCGKTTLFARLVEKERAKWKFIFDHKEGELCRRFKWADGKPARTLEELWAATAAGGYVVFDPTGEFGEDVQAGFDFFADFVFHVASSEVVGFHGTKLFCCDELQEFVEASAHETARDFMRMVRLGRIYGLDCYFVAQSSNEIHNWCRKQITEVYAFHQGDENACAWLKAKGFDDSELLKLPNGVWRWRNLRTGAARGGGQAF